MHEWEYIERQVSKFGKQFKDKAIDGKMRKSHQRLLCHIQKRASNEPVRNSEQIEVEGAKNLVEVTQKKKKKRHVNQESNRGHDFK